MTAEELLKSAEATPMAQSEKVEYVIDPDTRTIQLPSNTLPLGVESDQDVNRIYFRCPRIVGDNIDLSLLSLRVNYQNAQGEKDQYIITDMEVDGEDITFSWLLSRKVLQYRGQVNFIICAVKTEGSGTITNEWNTTLAAGTSLQGLEPDEIIIPDDEKDVINQLLEMVKQECEQAASDAIEQIGNEANVAGTAQIQRISNAADQEIEKIQTAWHQTEPDFQYDEETGELFWKNNAVESETQSEEQPEVAEAPAGYESLGAIGIVPKGVYSAATTYTRLNAVTYEGSTYLVLAESISGVTPSNDGTNYVLLAQGFTASDAADIEATDTYDLTTETPNPEGGSARKSLLQPLLDAIAKIVVKAITSDTFQNVLKQYTVNGGTANNEGLVLDARQGNDSLSGTLASRVKQNEEDINTLNSGYNYWLTRDNSGVVVGYEYDSANNFYLEAYDQENKNKRIYQFFFNTSYNGSIILQQYDAEGNHTGSRYFVRADDNHQYLFTWEEVSEGKYGLYCTVDGIEKVRIGQNN